MRKIGAVGVLFFLTLPLSADPVIYHDLADWAKAVVSQPNPSIEISAFSDSGQPVSPDVTLHDWEYPNILPPDWSFQNGVADLYTNPHHAPYLTFSTPIYSFGADFAFGVDGGLGVNLWNPAQLPQDVILDPPGSYACGPDYSAPVCGVDGFIGFTSTTPFNFLIFETTKGWGQSFDMSNMVYSTTPVFTPEPASIVLLVVGLLPLSFLRRLRVADRT